MQVGKDYIARKSGNWLSWHLPGSFVVRGVLGLSATYNGCVAAKGAYVPPILGSVVSNSNSKPDGSWLAETAERLRRFLLTHVQTAEQLKVLLLLRAHRETCMSPESASAILGMPTIQVMEALENLCDREVASVRHTNESVAYTYRAQDWEIEKTLDEIGMDVDPMPLVAIRMLNDNAIKRVRDAVRRTFEAAMRIRQGSGTFKVRGSSDT
jgi:hypothetical protein